MEPLSEIASFATITAGVIAVASAITAFIRWSNHALGERISEEIKVATYSISPMANGGLSLPDVARRTEAIERELLEMKGAVDMLVRIYTEEER
jgi:hypothetical protein